MLRLADHWVWDSWFARHEGVHHVFFLKAPRALGNPELRHWNARIGHAVSDDLRTWQVLSDALGPGPSGSWDDRATWTGSVLSHEGRWYLFYSAVSAADHGRVQRIGVAWSDDLVTWERSSHAPLVTADARWYERLDLDVWHEEACRDPWVFPDPSGTGFRMYYTARAKEGDPDGRGVVGQARSLDLLTWEVLPPVTEPGDFAHLEVPQVAAIGGRHYLVFSVYDWAHSARRRRRASVVCGTHYMIGDSPLGPWRMVTDEFLCATLDGRYYAGRLVEHSPGDWMFLSWAQFDERGGFVGALADPVPLVQHADGALSLAEQPRLAAIADPGAPP